MPQDAALAAAVGAVVLAFAACVYLRREPVADAGLGVEFVLPRPALLLETFAFIALGMLAAPLPFAALLWCSHGRGDTTAASRPIDAMLVLYGAAALSIPFMLDAPHSGGLAPLSQALVIWIAYWKALDIVAGTAPPAVLASPLNLVAHLCFLVEYHIAAQPPHPTSPKLPPQPWWRNQGLLGTEIAPAYELLPQLVEFASAGAGIMFFATVSMHSPPAWLVGSAAGGCVYTALLAYGSVWVVYLHLKMAADGNAIGLLILGYRPRVAFRTPLTASTSPTDFWSRRWNMIVRGLFHRSIFTPLRKRGVPAQLAALSSFVVSGLFHEYAFAPASGRRTLGCELAFFLVQAAFCTLELAMRAAGGGSVAERSARDGAKGPPALLSVVLTTLLLVPFSPLFLAPLQEAGTIDAMLATVVRVRFTGGNEA